MRGLARFQEAVLDAVQVLIRPLTEDKGRHAAAAEALENYLLDLPGPREVARKLDAREAYVAGIFEGFAEISKSLDALEDFQFFITRYPYRSTKMTRERHLQFLVEAYLAELYLLKERLSRYAVRVERLFKGCEGSHSFSVVRRKLVRLVNESLSGVIRTRDSHVHSRRFEDEGIARLGTISLLMKGTDRAFLSAMRILYRAEYPKVRNRWRSAISSNNRSIRRLLDAYFDELWPLLFDEQSKQLRYPSAPGV